MVALNWEAEPVFEGVEAPRYDTGLAAGGLSSDQIGTEAVLSSLEQTGSTGTEILADASDEGVIDEFAEVDAAGQWEAAYRLDQGDYVFRFDADQGEFVLVTNSSGSQSTADQLFAVARRYGYYGTDVRGQLRALEDRATALAKTVQERNFFAGETEPDIAAEAATLADELNVWLENYGEYPPEARLIELRIQLLRELEAVAASGSRGFDRYNDLSDQVLAAERAYNQGLE